MAAASMYIMNLTKSTYDQHTSAMQSHINVGYGSDNTISELAKTVSKVVGFRGDIDFDTSKPDGAPRKLMNSSRLKSLGWQAKISLHEGLSLAYQDFLKNKA